MKLSQLPHPHLPSRPAFLDHLPSMPSMSPGIARGLHIAGAISTRVAAVGIGIIVAHALIGDDSPSDEHRAARSLDADHDHDTDPAGL